MIIWAIFRMNWEVFFADPAPLVFTYLAYHMRATSLFFDLYPTVLAFANIFRIRIRPLIITLVNFLFACLSWMPGINTFKAICLMALTANGSW